MTLDRATVEQHGGCGVRSTGQRRRFDQGRAGRLGRMLVAMGAAGCPSSGLIRWRQLRSAQPGERGAGRRPRDEDLAELSGEGCRRRSHVLRHRGGRRCRRCAPCPHPRSSRRRTCRLAGERYEFGRICRPGWPARRVLRVARCRHWCGGCNGRGRGRLRGRGRGCRRGRSRSCHRGRSRSCRRGRGRSRGRGRRWHRGARTRVRRQRRAGRARKLRRRHHRRDDWRHKQARTQLAHHLIERVVSAPRSPTLALYRA